MDLARLERLCTALQQEPLFHLSLHSEELFHRDPQRLLNRKDDSHYGVAFVSAADASRMVSWARRLWTGLVLPPNGDGEGVRPTLRGGRIFYRNFLPDE